MFYIYTYIFNNVLNYIYQALRPICWHFKLSLRPQTSFPKAGQVQDVHEIHPFLCSLSKNYLSPISVNALSTQSSQSPSNLSLDSPLPLLNPSPLEHP